MSSPTTAPPHDAGLALAVVAASTSPLVLLDGELKVVAASDSFCDAFAIAADGVAGRSVFDLDGGEWNAPRLRSLLEATVSGAVIEAYDLDLPKPDGSPRQLVLNAHRLEYGGPGPVRLLLAVADVTGARASARLIDDILRDKAILLQEVRHRVANSLQIIASVLLQNARSVKSEESRAHLRDAHDRVMSVAALQRQLSASTIGDVALRGYFTKLCDSIAAAMIRDRDQVRLEVLADDSVVDADISVSLGLIVTELVINALKHAFPHRRRGRIVVGYAGEARSWTLSVTDDGVGMPRPPEVARPGLGTSIIQALSHQLNAGVEMVDAAPGTSVRIVHTHPALVEPQPHAQAV